GMVVARAVVRDISSGTEAARILALMVAIFTFAPMIAPIIGGFLVVQFGWRAPFAFVAFVGVIVLLAIRLILRETGQKRRDGHVFQQLWSSTRVFASHRRSIFGVLMIVLPTMGFMPVLSGAAALIIDIYGYTPAQFGFIFAAGGVSILAGSLLNRSLLLRFGTLQLIGIGATVIGLAGLELAVIAWRGSADFWWVWGGVCLYAGGTSFIASNATAMALDPAHRIAGVASSIIGTLQNVFGALSAIAAGLIYNGTVASNILLMAVFGILTFCLFLSRNAILRSRSETSATT
ncbi:MAG: MFS transporter, partial [Pseudomonadota bacterium]